MKCLFANNLRPLTIIHSPGQIRPQPGNVIPSRYSSTVIFTADDADHSVQFPPGDGAAIGLIKPACSTAPFGTMVQVIYSLPELAEVKWPDFLRTWLLHCRFPRTKPPLPAHQRRVAQPQLTCNAAVGQRISLFQISDHVQRPLYILIFFSPGPSRLPVSNPSAHPSKPSCASAARCPGGPPPAAFPTPVSGCLQDKKDVQGVDP